MRGRCLDSAAIGCCPTMSVMLTPLESDFLVPNATFIVVLVALVVLLLVVGLVVGGLLWLVLGRRGRAAER